MTGIAPSISRSIAPPTGSLSIEGNQPTIIAGEGINLLPATGALLIDGLTPSISRSITPQTGTLTVQGNQSSIGIAITPPTGTLSAVSTAGSRSDGLTPITATLTATGSISVLNVGIAPNTGLIATSGQPANVSGSLTPNTALLTISGLAPNIAVRISPPAGALNLQGMQPTIQAGDSINKIPETGSLTPRFDSSRHIQKHHPGNGIFSCKWQHAGNLFHPDTFCRNLIYSGYRSDISSRSKYIHHSEYRLTALNNEQLKPRNSSLNWTGSLSITSTVTPIGRGIVPLVGALSIQSTAATTSRSICPATGALALSGSLAAVSGSITPATGQLIVTGIIPPETQGIVQNPSTGNLSLSSSGPYLDRTIKPGTGSLVLTGTQAGVLFELQGQITITTKPGRLYFGLAVSMTRTPGTGSLTANRNPSFYSRNSHAHTRHWCFILNRTACDIERGHSANADSLDWSVILRSSPSKHHTTDRRFVSGNL